MTFETRTTCSFCGGALPDPELGEHGARFAAAAAAPAAARALAHPERGPLPPLGGPIALGIVALGLALAVARAWAGLVAVLGWPYGWLAPLPFAALLVGSGLWLARRLAPRRAPVVTAVALILRRRALQVGTLNGAPIVRHFATLASASGARRELRVDPALAAMLRDRTIGVAHVRGDTLAAFTPLEA